MEKLAEISILKLFTYVGTVSTLLLVGWLVGVEPVLTVMISYSLLTLFYLVLMRVVLVVATEVITMGISSVVKFISPGKFYKISSFFVRRYIYENLMAYVVYTVLFVGIVVTLVEVDKLLEVDRFIGVVLVYSATIGVFVLVKAVYFYLMLTLGRDGPKV